MAGGRKEEIEILLDKLRSCSVEKDHRSQDTSRDIVVDIARHLAGDLTPVQFNLYLSQLFGDNGIIAFGRSTVKDQTFVDARKETLVIISTLLEKESTEIVKYADDIRKYAMSLYFGDKSAKVRSTSLETFSTLLQKCSSHIDVDDLNVDSFIDRLCIDIKSTTGSTVVQQQLRMLGMLLNSYPERLSHRAELILKIFKDQLNKHMGSKIDLTALSGVLKGLTLYLHHFPEGIHNFSGTDEDPAMYEELYKNLYSSLKKILNPDLNLDRRAAQRDCLGLFHLHGKKFSIHMYEDYDTLYPWLLKWCNQYNRDDRRVAIPAMETFMYVVSKMLDSQAREGNRKGIKVFKYLLQQYNLLLETGKSTAQISLAVKGYGWLSGACSQYLTAAEVNTMFSHVLAASQYTFYQSSEMIETKLPNLPSYIEALAIIFDNMAAVNEVMLDSMLQLTLSLVEHFALLPASFRYLAYRAVFSFFHSVYRKEGGYLPDIIHSFVYRSILHTCSHEPAIDTSVAQEGGQSEAGEKWRGLKNEVVTYKTFLPLWESLLKAGKVDGIQVKEMSAVVKTEISSMLYSEFIVCTLEVTEKLNLDTYKNTEEKEQNNTADDQEAATSDPVSGLKATTPKDFQVYMNLVSLVDEILPLQKDTNLEQYVPILLHYFVRQSLLQPLVSAHYSVITSILKCSRSSTLFKDKEDPKCVTATHLVKSYIQELLQRCRQYRDQLLVACLTLILQLPSSVVVDIFPELIPPIQMALRLGVSYLPLAEICVRALQSWSSLLPKEMLHKYFPQVMPQLLPYLRSHESGGQAEVYSRALTVKMVYARQRRKVDQKELLESKKVSESAMRKVQMEMLRLIGSLDPALSLSVIPQDQDSLAALAVRWDTIKHIKFATPFENLKIDIKLDDLLPLVVDLALNSSDRQTKVVACELLHSLVVFMIGSGAQKSQETHEKYPMAPLYKRIFAAMLQLSCDPDQVTRQLFMTLTYQTIHWFTNNRNYENPDTVVLLDSIMEGIESPNDPALRDVSAQCLSEFVKWSRKQCRKDVKISANIKSILKRILSFCKHPSAFTRLGGALAWNSIYREFREDSLAVDIWTMEILVGLLTSLEWAQGDDPALGTQSQIKAAIQHVERILREKNQVFWKKSPHRRTSLDLSDGTMENLLEWLFSQIGKPKILFREKCFELLVVLIPFSEDKPNVQTFIQRCIKSRGLNKILETVESGGEALLGLRQHSTPTIHEGEPPMKEVKVFLEALVAALDGHSWLLHWSSNLSVQNLSSVKEVKVFAASEHFIECMSCCSIREYIENTHDKANVFLNPTELEAAMKLKCTAVVRLMSFVVIVLRDDTSKSTTILDSLLSPGFFRMVLLCVMEPQKVGFDIKDLEIAENLPKCIEEILRVLADKAPERFSLLFTDLLEKEIHSPQHDVLGNLPTSLAESSPIRMPSKQFLDGLQMLQKTQWLSKCSMVIQDMAKDISSWIGRSLFSVSGGTNCKAVYPHPSFNQLLESLLSLAFTLYPEILSQFLELATHTDVVTGHGGKQIRKGTHVMNVLGSYLIPYFVSDISMTVERCLHLIQRDTFESGISFASALLTSLLRNSGLRRKHCVDVLRSFLRNWNSFTSEIGKLSTRHESLLGVLSSMFLIDREGTMKSHVLNTNSDVVVFYRGLLSQSFELQLKIKALKLLPFFFTMSDSICSAVRESLDMLSLNHFPLKSTEFPVGGTKDREYHQALTELLTALELSASPLLLEFIVELFCREEKHRYEEDLQPSLEKFIKGQSMLKQVESLKHIYSIYSDGKRNPSFRVNVIDQIMMPLLQQASVTALERLLVDIIKDVMSKVSAPLGYRADDQLMMLISKIGSYSVLQVMYSKLHREKVFSPGSEISRSFNPSDETGKAMTKDLFRCGTKISKGELRHDQTHADLRRLCACAAYNAVIAALVCVQPEPRFYLNLLFQANATKGEAIWESLVDCNVKHEFDVEINFKPGSKKRFVALRQDLKESAKASGAGGKGAETVQYMASHYLMDSSLRDDLSQYDFNNSVVLAMSHTGTSYESRQVNMRDLDAELMTLSLDQSDYNEHEVMANLTAVINHMVEAKVIVLPTEQDAKPTSLPEWMRSIQEKLENTSCPRNVKLFLLRLMMNTSRVFAPYAAHFITSVLSCIANGTVGDNINYYLSDLFVMIMNWGKEGIPQDSVLGRNLADRVFRHLCKNLPNNRADIFKYNLEVIRSVVESWKNILSVPYDIVYSLMETTGGMNREVDAGLQLLGIVLANGISPHSVGNEAEAGRCKKLLLKLMCDKKASHHTAASELLGLYLKFLQTHNKETSDLEGIISKRISDLMKERTLQSQTLSCIHKIHKHYPAIVGKFINKLLNMLPRLYGIYRSMALECLVSYASELDDIFTHLKEQNLTEILIQKEPTTQLIALQLVHKVVHSFTPPQLLFFMPGITSFVNHPKPMCREQMYDILRWVYDTYRHSVEGDGKELESQARSILLDATKEEDAILQDKVLEFWLESFQSMHLGECLLHILRKLYSPGSEDAFLPIATFVILQAASRSADYNRSMFDQPLTECRFREMKVNSAWQAHHASIVPLFAETQSSGDSSFASYLSFTQGADMETDAVDAARVQATQQNAFAATQMTGASYNWVTGSTFDTTLADMEYEATYNPAQAQTSGLLFTVGSAEKDMRRYKDPTLGRSRMRPPDDNSNQDPESINQTKLIRRRFVKNQDKEKQIRYFSKQEARRKKLRESIERERKSRRESQVTIYRQYRVGELPDIQIPYKAILAPLRELSKRDSKVGGMLFELLTQGIIDNREFFMNDRDSDDWSQEVYQALNNIMESSYTYSPHLMKALLHLMINNDVMVEPENLSAACIDSHLEPLGILVLERQALLKKKDSRPSSKKRRLDANAEPSSDANLWLNLAELYKSLDMWDVVCGVVEEKLGNIKEETRKALQAEATNNPTQAFQQYRSAIYRDDWDEEPPPVETRIWKDWYAKCAGMLGQWNELESFVENGFLKGDSDAIDLNRIWNLPRPTAVALPSLVHSKLMKILDGSDSDGNLLTFVNNALKDNAHRVIMENLYPLQLAVLATHQKEGAQAHSYMNSTVISILESLSQYSILIPKPLKATLRHTQLLTELAEFLKISKNETSNSSSFHMKKSMLRWKDQEADPMDSPILIQCMASYRDLYLHCIQNQSSENLEQIVRDVKISTYRSVVKAALHNGNYHLADRHLRKVRSVSVDDRSLAQFYFLMTENALLRAKYNPAKSLQYLFDAWAKYMGKVSSSVLDSDSSLEAAYFSLESDLSLSISEAIKRVGDEWKNERNHLNALVSRFPSEDSQGSWTKVLLQSGFNCLIQAIKVSESKASAVEETTERNKAKVYMKLARYCEECMENWEGEIDVANYSKHLIIAIMKAMSLGSKEAHFQFPRVISILEANPSLEETFSSYSNMVPEWMYLLWLTHILIYLDKTPGVALQPIVERLAEEYPQAVVYAFRISMQQYDFSTAVGKCAKLMCEKVDAVLDRNPLFHHFTNALSLVSAPYIQCKDALSKLMSLKDKNGIDIGLRNLEENLLKVNTRSTKGDAEEKGDAYVKLDNLRKKAAEGLMKEFGDSFKKVKAKSLDEIKKKLAEIKQIFVKPPDKKEIHMQLKSYSPWLANFHDSRYSYTLEVPGQYAGLSKPLPEYHVKISNFDENILVMKSMRVPLRIVIRGNDEKDYKFLVKWGEDLRTDQRIEQVFVLMNSIYASSPLCANLTARPYLDTFQVIPMSLQVGLLQWVESTTPLQQFIDGSCEEHEKNDMITAMKSFNSNENWEPKKKAKPQDVMKVFKECVNKVRWDLLRRGLAKLSSSSEGFFYLRSSFAVSYATMCISHWLLGIGDRHLGNTLISLKSGRAVGIDFGHHFETSVQVIPVPELMPFRMTPLIANVFQPVGAVGALKEIMVAALGALRNSRHLLLAVLEAFVKEPTEDWKYFVKIEQGSTDDEKVELYSQERIRILKAKFNGINPAHVTTWAVKKNKSCAKDSSVLKRVCEAIEGSDKNTLRADIDRSGLDSHEQVDILFDLACDPNILGRTYIGWMPFV